MLTLASPGTKDALICGDARVSYDELLQLSEGAGRHLAGTEGAQIAILGENSLEWVVAAYGVWRRQKVLVPIDAQSLPEDVAYILADCSCAALFVSEELRDVADEALKKLVQDGRELPALFPLEGLLVRSREELAAEAIIQEDESQLAVIIYTSGTTGTPKGVMLTYGNLQANLRGATEAGYFQQNERVLVILPFHHVLPLMGCIMAPLATGGTAIFAPSLAREDVVKTLTEHKITMLVGVPRFYELLAKAIQTRIESSFVARRLFAFAKQRKSQRVSRLLFRSVHRGFGGHLNFMVCGGAALDPHVAELFLTLGFRLVEGYGMTECAPLITFPNPDWIKPGYCGRPLQGTEVELRDGEIFVKGPQVMLGYFGRSEETQAVLNNGWLATGDLGEFDSDGFLKITGRRKEILVLPSGKNVNPALGEELLLAACSDVDEAAIFLDGEVLHALLVPTVSPPHDSDPESFFWTHAVKAHNERVAPYRRLARLTLCREPLPRTRLGKLRRHQLPELARSLGIGAPTIDARPSSPIEAQLIRYFVANRATDVHGGSRLGADLGMDSLGKLELLEFVRKSFNTALPEDTLHDLLTVTTLAQTIECQGDSTAPDDLSLEVSWGEILSAPLARPLPETGAVHSALLLTFSTLLPLLWKFEVKGRDNLPKGPAILAPNHQSAADGLLLTCALGERQAKNTFFLGKEAHLKGGLARYLADRCRIIVLDQGSSVKDSLQAVAHVLGEGFKVVIFPEGTRTRTGELADFKQSYAIVATELGIPVVPVVIRGAFFVMPPGSRTPRLFRRMSLEFLPAVSPAGLTAHALNEEVHEKISVALAASPTLK